MPGDTLTAPTYPNPPGFPYTLRHPLTHVRGWTFEDVELVVKPLRLEARPASPPEMDFVAAWAEIEAAARKHAAASLIARLTAGDRPKE
jgi:hypothetical protein